MSVTLFPDNSRPEGSAQWANFVLWTLDTSCVGWGVVETINYTSLICRKPVSFQLILEASVAARPFSYKEGLKKNLKNTIKYPRLIVLYRLV